MRTSGQNTTIGACECIQTIRRRQCKEKSQGNPNVQENKKKYRKSNQFGKSEH